jgi:hypothetical protein
MLLGPLHGRRTPPADIPYLRRIRDLMLGSGIAAGNVDTVVVQLRHSLADDVADAINSFLSGNTGDQPQGAARRVKKLNRPQSSLTIRF